MVGKSPDCGAMVVSSQPQHALILNTTSFYRTPPSPNPSQKNFHTTQSTPMIEKLPTTQNIHTIDFPCPLFTDPEKKLFEGIYAHFVN